MQWILDNWFLILLVGAMIFMHLGHGKHGGKSDDTDEGSGSCKKTGKNCCGGHKKASQNEPETKLAPTPKTVVKTSKIPTIS